MNKRLSARTLITSAALLVILVVLLAASWAQFQVNQRRGWTAVDWTLTKKAFLSDQLQAGLELEVAKNPNSPGQLFHVIAPSLGLDRTFVAGESLLADDDVRIASNIKPFVAAGALKLVETGRLQLDAPIAPFLSPSVARILRDAGRDIDHVSLRQLLNHSSGIADYGSSRIFQAVAYVPTAFGMAWHWKPEDQIWFAAQFTRKGKVGEHFDYSDTNYLLASDMITKATRTANAGVALRDLLGWSDIGAETTFWEFYEPEPVGTRRIRQFRGAIEDTNLDVSFDQYGGGGLVMSMRDLAYAHRAVARGDVFDNSMTTALMQEAGVASSSNGYGLGIAKTIIGGETCWSHGGRWGTTALHCPGVNLTIARSWGQSNASPDLNDPKGPVVGLIKLIAANNPL
jgi:D-alanyl-D-alanine carboxypeptidase